MRSLKKLAVFLKPYWIGVIGAPLFMVLEVTMDLMQPRMLENIVDVGIAKMDMAVVIHTGLLMMLYAFVGAIGGIGCTYGAVWVSQAFSADVRSRLFRKVQSFSFGNLDKHDTGQLVTRLTNDVNQVGMLVQTVLQMMVRAPLTILGSLVLAIMTSPRLALLLMILVPFLVGILAWVVQKAYPLFGGVQQRLDRLNTILQEYLAGVRVVKAFVRAGHEKERFNSGNDDLRDQTIRANQFMAVVMPVMMFIINLGMVGAIWFGGVEVVSGSLEAGQLIAFINYLMRALGSIMMFSMMLVQISRAQASGDRIMEVLESEPEIKDRLSALPVLSPKGLVRFENVTFSYDGEAHSVLHNISFTAEPGKTVAVLGATGSGKSTLVNLIPRFYDVKAGRITLDGTDIRDLPQTALRRNIGIALQEVVLFSGTIRDNIAYGRPEASLEEVVAAARAAQADEFIRSFPEGYDTMVGQRGVNLSGGQKQRIAIARAILLQPVVLVLDDSTSSVDAETESKIQLALEGIMQGRTSFVIAQRISTVLTADKILVLDKGRLVAEGSHAELLASSPIYQEIFNSQLGGGPGNGRKPENNLPKNCLPASI